MPAALVPNEAIPELAARPEIRVHPRARTALQSLSEEEQQAVWAVAEALVNRDPASWPREQAIRLSADKPEYLLQVTPDLRAFLTLLAPRGIELLDIVREETLRLFLERYRAGAKVG